MKLQNLFKSYLLAILLFIILVVMSSVLIIQPSINHYILRVSEFIEDRLLEKSTASLSIENEKLNISFNILKKDEQNARVFLNRAGVEGGFPERISIGLDKESIQSLKQIVPTKLKLKISDGSLEFAGEEMRLIDSSFKKTIYEVSTGSAKIKLQSEGATDFSLSIDDLAAVFRESTASGKIHLSNKTNDWMPFFEKVVRIELLVNGKRIEGKIIIK